MSMRAWSPHSQMLALVVPARSASTPRGTAAMAAGRTAPLNLFLDKGQLSLDPRAQKPDFRGPSADGSSYRTMEMGARRGRTVGTAPPGAVGRAPTLSGQIRWTR